MLALCMVALTMRRKHNLAPLAWGGLTDLQQRCYVVFPHFSSSCLLWTSMAHVNVALQSHRSQSLPRVLRAAMEQNMPTANTSSGRQISFRSSRAVQLVDVLQQKHVFSGTNPCACSI